MLPIERMKLILDNKKPDRVPFIPTIYEHAARLINKTPSEVARKEDLLVNSHIKAYKTYKHDLVVVGMDIYNVEAEALGCKVRYYEDESLPGIKSHILADNKNKLTNIQLPDHNKDGRMPLFLNAARRVRDEIGDEVLVSSSIIGPFTLACLLRGLENFIFDMLTDESFARELLSFTTKVISRYGSEFIKRDVGISINDSFIAPPNLSPSLYNKFVFLEHKKLIRNLRSCGLDNISLISGGDTTSIAKMLIKTGTSLLLADSNADLDYFMEISKEANIMLRGTVNPQIIEGGGEEKIREETKQLIEKGEKYGKFIVGCGVVSYSTSPKNLLKLKKAINDFSTYKNNQYSTN
ncbi:MAG TPA: uroporphyrinogen decarboxylase family protein [Halanaerobiales bacterium]|nr:uroporphyrinogen decarboxylase family protein [Halanaerobiales bacterium]